MKTYPRTLAGIPIEESLSAPPDKIVIHPDLVAVMDRVILLKSVRTVIVNQPQEQ